MPRHLTLSTLVCAAALGVSPAGAAGPAAEADPRTGQDETGKADRAERSARKPAAAPEAAARWEGMRLEKEQLRAEREQLRAERERWKAEKERSRDPGKPGPERTGKDPPGGTDPARDAAEPDPRPTVIRYGTLPTDVPKWWPDVDADRDVQVSLFEWRTARRKVDEFVALDLNNDGFLTVEEYLRATAAGGPKRK